MGDGICVKLIRKVTAMWDPLCNTMWSAWPRAATRGLAGSSARIAAHARRDAAGRTPLGASHRGT